MIMVAVGAVMAEEPPTANAFGRAQVDGWKHLRTTRKVPARIGTTFGFRFKTVGKPAGEIVPIGKFQMPACSCRQLFKNIQVFINRFDYSRPPNLYNDLSSVR